MNKQNGANPVIDALLMRMNELNRFSDDDTIIQNGELLPLDVVVDKDGRFGMVATTHQSKSTGYWWCQIIGQCHIWLDCTHTHSIRTIDELEASQARQVLMAYFGGLA